MAPELGQEHDELIHSQKQLQQTLEGQREEFSMTQKALQAQVQDLEVVLRQQQGEMEHLREEESAAVRERDQLQHICQQLQQQVCIRSYLCSATPTLRLQCCHASEHVGQGIVDRMFAPVTSASTKPCCCPVLRNSQ